MFSPGGVSLVVSFWCCFDSGAFWQGVPGVVGVVAKFSAGVLVVFLLVVFCAAAVFCRGCFLLVALCGGGGGGRVFFRAGGCVFCYWCSVFW